MTNRGFLGGADRGRPRVDWRDLEEFNEGVIALTGMPGGGGILSAAIEHCANPAEPIEALGLTRRLMELYPNRLYHELAFHGNSAEKLVNRGLVAAVRADACRAAGQRRDRRALHLPASPGPQQTD